MLDLHSIMFSTMIVFPTFERLGYKNAGEEYFELFLWHPFAATAFIFGASVLIYSVVT